MTHLIIAGKESDPVFAEVCTQRNLHCRHTNLTLTLNIGRSLWILFAKEFARF